MEDWLENINLWLSENANLWLNKAGDKWEEWWNTPTTVKYAYGPHEVVGNNGLPHEVTERRGDVAKLMMAGIALPATATSAAFYGIPATVGGFIGGGIGDAVLGWAGEEAASGLNPNARTMFKDIFGFTGGVIGGGAGGVLGDFAGTVGPIMYRNLKTNLLFDLLARRFPRTGRPNVSNLNSYESVLGDTNGLNYFGMSPFLAARRVKADMARIPEGNRFALVDNGSTSTDSLPMVLHEFIDLAKAGNGVVEPVTANGQVTTLSLNGAGHSEAVVSHLNKMSKLYDLLSEITGVDLGLPEVSINRPGNIFDRIKSYFDAPTVGDNVNISVPSVAAKVTKRIETTNPRLKTVEPKVTETPTNIGDDGIPTISDAEFETIINRYTTDTNNIINNINHEQILNFIRNAGNFTTRRTK